MKYYGLLIGSPSPLSAVGMRQIPEDAPDLYKEARLYDNAHGTVVFDSLEKAQATFNYFKRVGWDVRGIIELGTLVELNGGLK